MRGANFWLVRVEIVAGHAVTVHPHWFADPHRLCVTVSAVLSASVQLVTDLISAAADISEEFNMEELESMLTEANKLGPRNLLGQPMPRVYLKDFINMMLTCGMIPSTA